MFRIRDWWIIVPLAALAMFVGAWGFVFDCKSPAPHGAIGMVGAFAQGAVRTIALMFLRGVGSEACRPLPTQVQIAQFALPVLALFGGAKIFLANLRRDMRVALAQRARDHIIVCGLGETGRQIAETLRSAGRSVVAVTLDVDAPNALACEALGMAVLKGDATHKAILRHAGVARASAVVVTTGDDSRNVEIGLGAAAAIRGLGRGRLRIVAEMRSSWMMERLLTHDTAALGRSGADFELLNLPINAARLLLRSAPMERAFMGAADRSRPLVAVVGFGAVAAEFVRRAACMSFAQPGVRPRFLILGDNAGEAEDALRRLSPGLLDVADFEFEASRFGSGNPTSRLTIEALLEREAVDAVVVALGEDDDALHAAFQFRMALDLQERLVTPVFVRLKRQHKLGGFLGEVESHVLAPDRLVPFGALSELASPEVLLDSELDRVARALHEVYLRGLPAGASSPAAVAWERLAERFKASSRDQADHLAGALRRAGYRLVAASGSPQPLEGEAEEALAQAEHWRWLTDRRASGWTYARTRNDGLKQSPSILEWGAMDDAARDYDRSFARSIPEILARAGRAAIREQTLILGADAETDLAAVDPKAELVLVIDPEIEAHWSVAAATVRARLRLRWRGGAVLKRLEAREDLQPLFARVEGWTNG